MNATDFLLIVIDAFGGSVHGRTLLQKRAYFASLLSGVDSGLAFDAHFYGPYSATVDNSVSRLKSLGFVNEENTGFGVAPSGFEIRRYDYNLTNDGKKIVGTLKSSSEYGSIVQACEAILKAGDPNYFELSIAAKANFILAKRGRAMSRDEIMREAQRFDWDIRRPSLDNAVRFLEKLGLVQDGNSPE